MITTKLHHWQEIGPQSKIAQLIAIVLIVSFAASVAWLVPGSGGLDFLECFYPIGRALLHGENPYSNPCYYNPPWLTAFLAAFALLPINLAWRLWMTLALIIYVLSFHRLQIPMPGIVALAFSPFLLMGIYYSNIDWIVLFGATLPPPIGIWLVILKPQIGAPLILLWSWKAYRSGGMTRVTRLLAPISFTLLICFALGLYRLPDTRLFSTSADIFPFGVPLGLLLLGFAFLRSDLRLVLSASPFLSPYLSISTWLIAGFPIALSRRGSFLLAPLSWLFLLLLQFVME